MRRLLAPLALILLAGAPLAACGGDDTQSKEAWVEQADAICAAGDEDLNQAAEDSFGGTAPSVADQEQFVTDEVVPSLQSQHDQIADLDAPEGSEEQADALLTSLQEGIDALSEDPSSITEAGAKSPLADASEQAGELGLTNCGG